MTDDPNRLRVTSDAHHPPTLYGAWAERKIRGSAVMDDSRRIRQPVAESPFARPVTRIVRTLLALALFGTSASAGAHAQPVDDGWLDLLEWRSIGPTRGGRVLGVAGHATDDLVFYQGGAGGGVWKTEDGGANWRNVSDGYFGTGSVGAVEVSRSHPDIVYVGMGETCIRGNASHGDGVYRSDDGGASWRRLGLAETLQIARVRVHPENPDIAWVAALGDAWGASAARGVYRTRDGGATWEKVLYRDENSGAIDLVLDPANPDILYASLLELRRFPLGFPQRGPRHRTLQEHGRRRHLDRTDRQPRSPVRSQGTDRHRRLATELRSPVGDHRRGARGEGDLPLR